MDPTETRLRQGHQGLDPVRNLLSTHCYATLIVPCEDGSVYHLRKPGRPEFQQGQLYKLFGVKISNLLKTTVKFRETDTD